MQVSYNVAVICQSAQVSRCVCTCMYTVWDCAIVVYLFLRKAFVCYLMFLIGYDFNFQGRNLLLVILLSVVVISVHAMDNLNKGKECCLLLLMSA